MKFWNKSKEYRKTWTKAEPKRIWSTMPNGSSAAFPEWQPTAQMKRWCQMQSSKGRFYFDYPLGSWYFEYEKDATWFLLNWS